MPKYFCVAEGCNSDTRKKGLYGYMIDITFFPFPSSKQPRIRRKWLDLLRRQDFEPSRHDRICSRHFVDGRPTEAHPFPELFKYNSYKSSEGTRGTSSIDKRSSKKIKLDSCSSHDEDVDFSPFYEAPAALLLTEKEYGKELPFPFPVGKEEIVSSNTYALNSFEFQTSIHDHDYCHAGGIQALTHEIECQTDISMKDMENTEAELHQLREMVKDKRELRRYLAVDKMTKSDSSVKSYFGLPSVLALFGIFAILDKITPTLTYWKGASGTSNNAAHHPKKTGPNRKLTRFHEFLLTLLRLRLALPTFVIADIFGISCSRVSQTFITWINYMDLVFTPMLKWPSTKCIKKFMPKCFKTTFPRTTCIIDCTEFFIERPSTPTAQVRTFSSYKQKNTFKALVAVTPSGAFIFVSKLWGGNVSDRYITEHSGFLDNIKSGDEVMADRGFVIRDLLLERRATLNIPPFTKKCSWGKGKHLTAQDILKTKKIAKLRIHVERAIGRLKNYKILSHNIPLKIKPVCNQIVRVCAFFSNVQEPLVKYFM